MPSELIKGEKHFGNEAKVTLHKNINLVPKATFSLSHDFIFFEDVTFIRKIFGVI